MPNDDDLVKGRGAQFNPNNPFLKDERGQFHGEGIDEHFNGAPKTQFFNEHPKKVVNKVPSPDLGFDYSLNPYQGCEHGCIYCYARNSHTYWGYSSGLDFEQKIIVKENAAETLEKQLQSSKWRVNTIMLSGNTDCYQPVERKLGITRKILEVLNRFQHPVGIITKNDLICRDIDILKELADKNLVGVNLSINAVDEAIRRKLEPRTVSYTKRFEAVQKLSEAGIPVNVMIAPVIPGLNVSAIPEIVQRAKQMGARSVSYIVLRLNGQVAPLFIDWVQKAYPDKSEKILNQVASCHGGQLNDSRFGTRMTGDGVVADSIRQLFEIARNKYFGDSRMPELDKSLFKLPGDGQLGLF